MDYGVLNRQSLRVTSTTLISNPWNVSSLVVAHLQATYCSEAGSIPSIFDARCFNNANFGSFYRFRSSSRGAFYEKRSTSGFSASVPILLRMVHRRALVDFGTPRAAAYPHRRLPGRTEVHAVRQVLTAHDAELQVRLEDSSPATDTYSALEVLELDICETRALFVVEAPCPCCRSGGKRIAAASDSLALGPRQDEHLTSRRC